MSDLHGQEITWRYQSALTPEQLAELLPALQGVGPEKTNVTLSWKNVSPAGFELSYDVDVYEFSLPAIGHMQPDGKGTMIVVIPPRPTRQLMIFLTAFVMTLIGVTWASWPILDIAPVFWIINPLIFILLFGGVWARYLYQWRRHCNCLDVALCQILHAERMHQ